jgi:transcription elongation factor Elf1
VNPLVYTKDGRPRKYAPKKYVCTYCELKTSKPATVKLPGVSFYVCPSCGGRLEETPEYKEWLNEHLKISTQED